MPKDLTGGTTSDTLTVTGSDENPTLTGVAAPEDGQDDAGATAQQPENFEQWLAAQADDVQGMFETHIAGLKSALSTERDNRKQLAKTVKDLQASAGKASDLQERLVALEAQMAEQGHYAQFVEAAAAVGVKNIRLAWLAAKEFSLLDDSGEVDLDALKAQVPELFAKPTPLVSAGAGTGAPPKTATSMNDLIRSAAGRNGR